MEQKFTEYEQEILKGLEGFYKVGEDGGTLVVDIFFNPTTKEEKYISVRDYDYSDGSRDFDYLYYMPINEDIKKLFLRHRGVISVGDFVKVVKGRKIPIGTIGKVKRFFDYKDRYGRVQTTYAILEDGQKTSVSNLELL